MVKQTTLFIFVEIVVYIYILLVYNSDQEVEVNLDYTYKRRYYMEKLERYNELEDVCYGVIRRGEIIPLDVLEEMKNLAVTKAMFFEIELFEYYNEVISDIRKGEM